MKVEVSHTEVVEGRGVVVTRVVEAVSEEAVEATLAAHEWVSDAW